MGGHCSTIRGSGTGLRLCRVGMSQTVFPYLQDLRVVDFGVHAKPFHSRTSFLGIGGWVGRAATRTDGCGHPGLSGLNELVTGFTDVLNVGRGLTRLGQLIGRRQAGP